jgi:hypothetical protein
VRAGGDKYNRRGEACQRWYGLRSLDHGAGGAHGFRLKSRAIAARVATLAGAKAGGLCRAPINKETDMPAERRGRRTAGAAINPLTGDSVKKSATGGRCIARQHGSEAGIIKIFCCVLHASMFGGSPISRHPLLART